jgi:hypothetical protein
MDLTAKEAAKIIFGHIIHSQGKPYKPCFINLDKKRI